MQLSRSRVLMFGFGVLALLPGRAAPASAAPADPDLIPEARRVLAYLESVYGKKTLAGMSSYGGWRPIYEMSGRAPAIYGHDIYGWNKPRWGESHRKVVQSAVDGTRDWWLEQGGIPQLQYHWGRPDRPDGSAWVAGNRGSGAVDMAAFVTPGTPEHTAAMSDLRQTADALEQLARARVPVLWRPFHEIDGGWFWWTDPDRPENTAAAWRLMFDYLVKERKLHNLIWVYNPGVQAAGYQKRLRAEKREATLADEIEFRRRYYPGDAYVDLAGIDIYPNKAQGYGDPQSDTYPRAFALMQGIAPGKLLALCEGAALVDPDQLETAGPGWLYVLPWFSGGANPSAWIRRSFNHAQYLTLDELPLLAEHNIAPHVRLVQPLDGASVGTRVAVEAIAGDRNGNLQSVEFRAIPGAWFDWSLRERRALQESLARAKPLGTGRVSADGRCGWDWAGVAPGLYSVAAVARDTEGKETLSNFVRVVVGAKNLAAGRTATSSAAGRNADPGNAVDGDLFHGWNGDKEGEPWLAVDLGEEQVVGAATLTWGKAYAKTYVVEISSDGSAWREVFRRSGKTGQSGDTDVARFTPERARHVRVRCLERGTTWGGYVLQELGVYPSLPE